MCSQVASLVEVVQFEGQDPSVSTMNQYAWQEFSLKEMTTL